MGSTTEESLVLPNEWLDYFYQQQIIDDFDVPFGAISDPAVSDDTSFGDDVLTPGTQQTAASFLNIGAGGEDESVLVHDGQPPGFTSSNNAAATSASAAAAAAKGLTVSPENSSAASAVDLSPKAAIGKQVKRRSRASRRTPTTLLNASIKNFRTLVQQYTGCQSAAPGFGRNGKGPINLSFGAGNNDRADFPASFEHGNYYYNNTHDSHHQLHMNQHQVDQIYAERY